MSAKGHGRVDLARLRRDVNMLALLPADANVRPCGRNHWRARCPIHGGTGQTLGIWYGAHGWSFNCFACNEQGQVIDFVMKLERIGFKEAVAKLSGSDLGPPVVLWAPPAAPKKAYVLPCVGNCGERLEVDLADVPYLGAGLHNAWTFKRTDDDVLARCPRCTRAAADLAPGPRARASKLIFHALTRADEPRHQQRRAA